jgi:flagellar FliL protein
MAAGTAIAGGTIPAEARAKPGKKRLVLLLAPAVLAAVSAGLWFGGVLRPLLGAHAAPGTPAAAQAANAVAAATPPVFLDMPEIVSNLDAGRRDSFIKLHARLELAAERDTATVTTDMPRLLDLFGTYLREMHPEELRGSAGTWRLREELIARANIAVAPAHVTDVLFTEMLIQ